MQLPTEVRLKILIELLWQEEPLKVTREAGIRWRSRVEEPRDGFPVSLHRESNFKLHPAILRVCHSIYEEGMPILYKNTIGCEVFCDFDCLISDEPCRSSFLRPGWDIRGKHIPPRGASYDPIYASPRALMSRVRSLDVLVRVEADDECSSTRIAVRTFVQAIRGLPQLSEISIHLEIPPEPAPRFGSDTWRYENEEISLQDYKDFALGPFALMRNLSSVAFTGVSTNIAEELTKAMVSQEPIVDLPRMNDALREYIRERLRYGHCRACRRALLHAVRADHEVDMEDERAFRRSRSKIFAIIAEHEKRDLRNSLQYDPKLGSDTVSEDLVSGIEVEDNDSSPSEDENEQLERLEFILETQDEESADDRRVNREQETERPSLVRLRKVVCRERAFNMY